MSVIYAVADTVTVSVSSREGPSRLLTSLNKDNNG